MPAVNPTLPILGGLRGAQELAEITALAAIRTAINGTLDTANLTADPFSVYTTIFEASGFITSADGTTQRFFRADGNPATGANDQSRVPGLIVPSSSPWTLSGRTPKLRLVAHTTSNQNPNLGMPGTDQAFQVLLVPVTIGGTGGGFNLTAGSAVSTLTVNTSTTSNLNSFTTTSDFNVPAAGIYVFKAGVGPLGSSLVAGFIVSFSMRVELHYI